MGRWQYHITWQSNGLIIDSSHKQIRNTEESEKSYPSDDNMMREVPTECKQTNTM